MDTLTAMAMALAVAAAPAPHRGELAPEPEAASEDPGLGRLLHATPAAVRARLGDPDVARAEGLGALWTYRLPHCALFLFFHDGPRGLRVMGAATGPRRRGEAAPTVPACLASAVQLPD